MLKFTDFITWPKDAFESDQQNFVLGILGDPKIFKLISSLRDKEIQGRPLTVVRLDEWTGGPMVHMIYMDPSRLELWHSQIKQDRRKAILTVSGSDAFLQAGGILSFIKKEGGQIGFSVNRTAQQKSGLVFSSALLRLAKIRNFDPEAGE